MHIAVVNGNKGIEWLADTFVSISKAISNHQRSQITRIMPQLSIIIQYPDGPCLLEETIGNRRCIKCTWILKQSNISGSVAFKGLHQCLYDDNQIKALRIIRGNWFLNDVLSKYLCSKFEWNVKPIANYSIVTSGLLLKLGIDY